MSVRAAALLLFAPWLAWADPNFRLPIDCNPGTDCFVQNYFDHDPGPGWRDHACGGLAYDGHEGTDIRLRNLRRMEEGVAVLAAAAGRVVAVRDGEADHLPGENVFPPGRAAGNSVRIDHGDGWETQYSHLRRGSVRVHKGQPVAAGDVLGFVGLSGNSAFPHLELVVRKNAKALDPFAPEGGTCGLASASSLFDPQTSARLGYIATGVLNSGFLNRVPTAQDIQEGTPLAGVGTDAPALVFYVELFGVRAGDRQDMTLSDPAGRVLARQGGVLPAAKAVWRAHAGVRRPAGGWQTGTYVGRYRLRREGAPDIEAVARITVAASTAGASEGREP
jgi:hypothetical protein